MGESFTIQISANLVKQLADDGEKLKKKPKRPKSKPPQQPKQSQKVHQKPISDDSRMAQGSAPVGWPLQAPLFLPQSSPALAANAELDAIRSTLQQSERVLEKLQKQEEHMVQEVTQRAKDLHEKEFKLPYQKPMPCLAEKDACTECYKAHIGNPLKCADAVKNYADCTRRVRQQTTAVNQ